MPQQVLQHCCGHHLTSSTTFSFDSHLFSIQITHKHTPSLAENSLGKRSEKLWACVDYKELLGISKSWILRCEKHVIFVFNCVSTRGFLWIKSYATERYIAVSNTHFILCFARLRFAKLSAQINRNPGRVHGASALRFGGKHPHITWSLVLAWLCPTSVNITFASSIQPLFSKTNEPWH